MPVYYHILTIDLLGGRLFGTGSPQVFCEKKATAAGGQGDKYNQSRSDVKFARELVPLQSVMKAWSEVAALSVSAAGVQCKHRPKTVPASCAYLCRSVATYLGH